MTEPTVLTEELLERIAWYARQASPPPVQVIQIPDDCDPLDWIADCLAKTVGDTVYGVAMGTPEEMAEQGAIVTALTGNGSAARANANFYMLCHTAVPLLVAEVRTLWAAERQTRAVPDMTHGG